jgi:YegS/Rv2252/BmrU family lipid kinase
MTQSLVIINPHAGGKRALTIWQQHETTLRERLGHVEGVITESQDDIAAVLESASERGITRIISIGGDGTNHHTVNAIMRHNLAFPSRSLTYATIPAGTGRDWSRGAGTPLDVTQAIDWIANTRLRPIDIGLATLDGHERYFLNTSSVGISNDVVQRVEASSKGGQVTFFKAIVSSILFYRAIPVRIYLNDALWWDEPLYLGGFANGKYFGQGLKVAPNAEVDDGLFDIMAAGDMRVYSVFNLLRQLYSGSHIFNHRVKVGRASNVRVVSTSGAPIGLDLDGEGAHAADITYRVLPRALLMNT